MNVIDLEISLRLGSILDLRCSITRVSSYLSRVLLFN